MTFLLPVDALIYTVPIVSSAMDFWGGYFTSRYFAAALVTGMVLLLVLRQLGRKL